MADSGPSYLPDTQAPTANFREILPSSERPRLERSIGLRAATRCFAMLCEGPHVARCHAVEFSPSGVIVDLGRPASVHEPHANLKLLLFLPDQVVVRALVKVVRKLTETRYALKFLMISDVDRVTLMEHVDRECTASLRLLREIEASA